MCHFTATDAVYIDGSADIIAVMLVPLMCFLVLSELLDSQESLSTHVTAVGPFATVHEPVLVEVGHVGERGAADSTLERPFSRVDPCVLGELGSVIEPPAAHVAGEEPHAGVDVFHVHLEVALGREVLIWAAETARVFFNGGLQWQVGPEYVCLEVSLLAKRGAIAELAAEAGAVLQGVGVEGFGFDEEAAVVADCHLGLGGIGIGFCVKNGIVTLIIYVNSMRRLDH